MKNFLIFFAMTLLGFLVNPKINHAQCPYFSTTVSTVRNTVVPAFSSNCETKTQAQLADATAWVANNFPQANVQGSATGRYNCHSYSWHSATPLNTIWIDGPTPPPNSPNQAKYWEDGSHTYSESTFTRWSYVSGDHSAIAVPANQTQTVWSKWGYSPLMQHSRIYCPYMPQYGGSTSNFWSFQSCPVSSNTCKAPGAFWPTNKTSTTVRLNLTRACNASQYQIQYKLNVSSNWNVLATYNAPPNPHFAFYYLISGMVPNTCYDFRLKVINGTSSVYSSVQLVCTNAQRPSRENEDISKLFEGEIIIAMEEISLLEAEISPEIAERDERIQTTCSSTVNGYLISTTQVAENSEYFLANTLGQIVCSGKSKDGSIQCEVKTPGVYSFSIIDGAGNKCSQKIFVK